MRNVKLFIALALVVGLVGAYAATGYAYPSMNSSCAGCHSGAAIAVTAAEATNDGSTATYNVSAPGAAAIAVFDGTTKVSQLDTAAGVVSVAAGKTYVLQAVAGPTKSSGLGTVTISPVSNAGSTIPTGTPDTTCAITTCDCSATYAGDATIKLTATDKPGGWGVGYIYYKLDNDPVRLVSAPVDWAAGTCRMSFTGTVQVPAPAAGSESHTLKYWSQDNYGIIEAANVVTFKVFATHAITATAGLNGTISASKTVSDGDDATFAITPNPGYHVVSVTVDGVDKGALTSYTFSNIAGDHTIAATFAWTKLATKTTLKANVTSMRSGGYVTLTAKLSGGTFANQYVRFEVLRKGSSSYALLKTVKVSSSGTATYRYKVLAKGTRYHRVSFLGDATYLAAPVLKGIKLSVY